MVDRCITVVIIIIVIVFILIGLALVWWEDKPLVPTPPPPVPATTTDRLTYTQYVSAKAGQSTQQEIKATDGSILGEARQVFLTPPTKEPAMVRVGDGSVKYTYRGEGSNGFELRWLGYTNHSTVPIVDLSDLQKFTVEVSELDFINENTTFTLQLNVSDKEGLESSVVDIVKGPKTATFDRDLFIGNEPGQHIDFANVTAIWMGGDFRTVNAQGEDSLTRGGNVTLKPLTFVRS